MMISNIICFAFKLHSLIHLHPYSWARLSLLLNAVFKGKLTYIYILPYLEFFKLSQKVLSPYFQDVRFSLTQICASLIFGRLFQFLTKPLVVLTPNTKTTQLMSQHILVSTVILEEDTH